MKITVELTDKEAEKLIDQLEVTDAGPCCEGWCSDELMELEAKFRNAIEVARYPVHARRKE